MMRRICLSLLLLTLTACSGEKGGDKAGVESIPVSLQQEGGSVQAENVSALFDQYWEDYLNLHPLAATFYGYPRYNGQMHNF